MSFSCQDNATGLQYSSLGLGGFFAQRANLLRPSYWAFLLGIRRFCMRTLDQFERGRLGGLTLGQFAEREGFRQDVIEQFVVPMASAIWSASEAKTMEFPMESFARFYSNHGLLTLWDPPAWYCVPDRSRAYVKAFQDTLGGRCRPECPVRSNCGDRVPAFHELADGAEDYLDAVVIAAHADGIQLPGGPRRRRLLGRRLLDEFHTVLPPGHIPCTRKTRKAWAWWNLSPRPSHSRTFFRASSPSTWTTCSTSARRTTTTSPSTLETGQRPPRSSEKWSTTTRCTPLNPWQQKGTPLPQRETQHVLLRAYFGYGSTRTAHDPPSRWHAFSKSSYERISLQRADRASPPQAQDHRFSYPLYVTASTWRNCPSWTAGSPSSATTVSGPQRFTTRTTSTAAPVRSA